MFQWDFIPFSSFRFNVDLKFVREERKKTFLLSDMYYHIGLLEQDKPQGAVSINSI